MRTSYEVRIAAAPAGSFRRVGDFVAEFGTEAEAVFFTGLAPRLGSLRGCRLHVVVVTFPGRHRPPSPAPTAAA